jgi:hypothetical protein
MAIVIKPKATLHVHDAPHLATPCSGSIRSPPMAPDSFVALADKLVQTRAGGGESDARATSVIEELALGACAWPAALADVVATFPDGTAGERLKTPTLIARTTQPFAICPHHWIDRFSGSVAHLQRFIFSAWASIAASLNSLARDFSKLLGSRFQRAECSGC